MTTSDVFRHELARRILALVTISLPAGACVMRSHSSVEGCDPRPTETERCIAPSYVAGAGATPDAGQTGDASDAGTADGPASHGSGTDAGSTAPSCASRADAKKQMQFVDEVTTDATLKDDRCCYTVVYTPICEGRPYLVDAAARTADAVRGRSVAGAYRIDAPSPRVDTLDPAARAELAAQWTRDGLFEHASVASFGRFAMELLALGAPAELIEEAHRAALDEMHHARLCFALASAYAGEPIAPGPFPFDGRVEVSSDLAAVAARAVAEGCIGETLAASIAAEQLALAVDPSVRAALSTIVADEARHAELAWRFVAWALRTGGSAVLEAVTEAFGVAPRLEAPARFEIALASHGRLDGVQLEQAASRAFDEVVRPAARALLAATTATATTSASEPSAAAALTATSA